MSPRVVDWIRKAVPVNLIAAVTVVSAVQGAESPPQVTRPEFQPRVVVNRVFPPIVDAPVLTADKVSDQVTDNELVLGIVVDGEARAYPINMLTGPSREIINDSLGGRAIAATW